mgnify:CR=1 FL=1
MLDIGWSEMAIIVLVAVVVIGPKDLPGAIRSVAGWLKKARQMSREFQTGLDDMLREADLDDARKAIDAARHRNLGKLIEQEIDPDGEIGRQFREMDADTRKPLPPSTKSEQPPQAAARNPVESVPTGSGESPEAPPEEGPQNPPPKDAPAADAAPARPEEPKASYVRTPAQVAPGSSVRPPEPAPKNEA